VKGRQERQESAKTLLFELRITKADSL
jgi:hypothetical protein